MRQLVTKIAQTLLACTFLVTSVDCGVKELLNCRSICNKKRECGSNSSYDVDHCTDTCSDTANNDEEYARKVNTCKECVDPLSCNDYKVAACLVNCPALP
jgi:hypothetical protein